jgi:hypothetical protein
MPTERRRGLRRASDRGGPSDRRVPPPGESIDVTRIGFADLFDRVENLAQRLTRAEADLQIQFTRIAELQAELDAVRKDRSS